MDVHGDQADLALLLEQSDVFPVYKKYQPLDKTIRSIRLLRIWHESNGEIHAAITHASFDDQVDYEALSYCWGPPDIPKTIYIGQEALFIRSSLHGLLDALCQNNQTLPVWVDAICINQRDVHERNWQVSMMGDIYRHATRVKSWIGPSDGHSEYAFAYINHYRDKAFLSSPIFDRIQRKAHESFRIILDRPYWKRLWIIQEMALACELFILCGSRIINWEAFLNAYNHAFPSSDHIISSLSHLKEELSEPVAPTSGLSTSIVNPSELDDQAQRYRQDLYQPKSTPNPLGLPKSSLLVQASRFGGQACEDPRDRVFGILNLVEDGEQITVDYTRSLADITMEVILATYCNSLQSRANTATEPLYAMRCQEIDHCEIQVDTTELITLLNLPRSYLLSAKLLTNPHELLCSLSDMKSRLGIRYRPGRLSRNNSHWVWELATDYQVALYHSKDAKSYDRLSAYGESFLIQWTSHEAAPQLIRQISNHRGGPDLYGLLLKFQEMQICSQASICQDTQVKTCEIFLHLSPFAILAFVCFGIYCGETRDMLKIKACLQDRRSKYPPPRLCMCELSAELNLEAFTAYEEERQRNEEMERKRMEEEIELKRIKKKKKRKRTKG